MSKRRTMQVAEEFHQIVEQLRKEIMQEQGVFIGAREITAKIKKEDLKKMILEKSEDIKLGFDRRRKR